MYTYSLKNLNRNRARVGARGMPVKGTKSASHHENDDAVMQRPCLLTILCRLLTNSEGRDILCQVFLSQIRKLIKRAGGDDRFRALTVAMVSQVGTYLQPHQVVYKYVQLSGCVSASIKWTKKERSRTRPTEDP